MPLLSVWLLFYFMSLLCLLLHNFTNLHTVLSYFVKPFTFSIFFCFLFSFLLLLYFRFLFCLYPVKDCWNGGEWYSFKILSHEYELFNSNSTKYSAERALHLNLYTYVRWLSHIFFLLLLHICLQIVIVLIALLSSKTRFITVFHISFIDLGVTLKTYIVWFFFSAIFFLFFVLVMLLYFYFLLLSLLILSPNEIHKTDGKREKSKVIFLCLCVPSMFRM